MQTTRDIVVPDMSHITKEVKFWDGNVRQYKHHQQELDEAWRRVNESGQLICGNGPFVEEFEQKFADFTNKKYCIMTGAGTHALYLAYKALGIGPEDEVITTSHTFIATIDQIVALGAAPILVDIGEDGLIDPVEVAKAITARTKAIVPVHLEGKVCNLDSLKFGIPIVEDAAQAIGAQVGDLACWSFHPAKILGSVGNAGAITTNDIVLANRLREMRSFSNIGKNPDLNAEWGGNYEPDNLQAEVLNIKFRYLKDWIHIRKLHAQRYDEGLKNLPLTLPAKREIYQDYVIRTPDQKELAAYLKDHKIGILGHEIIPNHAYNILSQFKLPKTDAYLATQIRLPLRPEHTEKEIDFVIKTIQDFYDKK